MDTQWNRVNGRNPCRICGKSDWCTYTLDGACCMRIESDRSMRNGGWFHSFTGGSSTIEQRAYNPPMAVQLRSRPPDFSKLIAKWQDQKAGELESLAATLGVEQWSLKDLNVCWAKEYDAFAFPMYDPGGNIVGIRLRNSQRKWAVVGSKQGLFLPFGAVNRWGAEVVLIVEGPTDTAAGLSLGFFTIGRANNLTGAEMVVATLEQLPVKEVVVCYDNDEHLDSTGKRIRPGPVGAERLIKSLKYPVTRFVPPTKDLRSYLTSGGTRKMLLSTIGNTVRT